jgi:hypothetical protein
MDEITELVMVVRLVMVDGGTVEVKVVTEPEMEIVEVMVEPGSV